MIRLRCLIDGEFLVFAVQVGRNVEVQELKEIIQSELGFLKDVRSTFVGTIESEWFISNQTTT